MCMRLYVKTVVALCLVTICFFRSTSMAAAQATSFTVMRVTSLADSGAGTLRECVSKGVPRVCVFEVSGRIKLASDLVITQPNLIIAGQTAPSPGILVSNAGITVKSHHVRIEHIAVRAGDERSGPDPRSRDSMSIQGSSAYDVRLKNLSISWGVDENFSTYQGIKNVTVENSIISEGLMYSLHPKGHHSMGALVGETARNVVFRNNLLAVNNDRNIRWKFDTTGAMINNVIYGWGGTSSWNTTNLSDTDGANKANVLDIIGNRYIPGPQGLQTAYAVYSSRVPSNSKIYLADNIAPRLTNVSSSFLVKTPNFAITNVMSVADAYDYVLASAGSRPWDRNADDIRVIAGVKARTLKLRNAVGTWPSYGVNRRAVEIPDGAVGLDRVNAVLASYEKSSGPVVAETPTVPMVPTATPRPTSAPTQVATPVPPTPPTMSPSTRGTPRVPSAALAYTVLKVTSLANSGRGTLRDCVEKPFPRVCVFEVSGRIKLTSNIVVDQPNLVIAGQTAPSPGIVLTNAGLVVRSHDVRVEHLSVRSGDAPDGPAPASRRSISVRGSSAYNVRFKNLSVSWAVDENVQTAGPVKNVVFENCIISEALNRSIHPKGAHSMGVLVNQRARGVRFVGNLLAANHDRNIRWKYDTRGEMINNVIYGWGGTSSWNTTNISDLHNTDRATLLDAIGNVFLAGPQGVSTAYAFYSANTPRGSKIFLSDNIAPRLTNIAPRYRVTRRIFPGTTAAPASTTLEAVLRNAGARPWDRNPEDSRVIEGVRARTLRIRNRVGAWPMYARNRRSIQIADALIAQDRLDQALPLFESKMGAPTPTSF